MSSRYPKRTPTPTEQEQKAPLLKRGLFLYGALTVRMQRRVGKSSQKSVYTKMELEPSPKMRTNERKKETPRASDPTMKPKAI